METVAQLLDVGTLLAYQPLLEGDRVAIVGNLRPWARSWPTPSLEEGLRLAHEAPVDIGVTGGPELSGPRCRRRSTTMPSTRSSPCSCHRSWRGRSGTPALRDVAQKSTKPVVATFLSTEGVPDELAVLDDDGMPARGSVPSFATPSGP